MALNLKNPEADRLARKLAEQTGESITDAVIIALRERLERTRSRKRKAAGLAAELLEIGHHFNSLPVLDARNEDEILGFGTRGV